MEGFSLSTFLNLLERFESVVIIGGCAFVILLHKQLIAWLVGQLGLKELRRDMIKNRLLTNLYLRPDKVESIEADYKEYKERYDGNGYMDCEISDWRKAMRGERQWNGIDRRRNRD